MGFFSILVEMGKYATLLLSLSHLLELVLGGLNECEAITIHATNLFSRKKISFVQQYHLRNKTLKGQICLSGCRIVESRKRNQGYWDTSSTDKTRIIINYCFYCMLLCSAVFKEYIKKPQHGCFLLCKEMLKSV